MQYHGQPFQGGRSIQPLLELEDSRLPYDPSTARSPYSLNEIASFHAHIYFDPDTRAEAEQLRDWIGERFPVTLGRWHYVKVGPHDEPMFQVAFAVDLFSLLVPWLMLNHGRLSILVHPNTANPRRDHSSNALWIGRSLVLHIETLPDESAPEQPPSPNTSPSKPA
jgi:DOPA 4,5-dioxygenase